MASGIQGKLKVEETTLNRRHLGRGWAIGLAVFAVLFCLWGAAPASAQGALAAMASGGASGDSSGSENAGPEVSAEDLRSLADTIEDPAKREEFLKNLRGLIEAAKDEKAEEEPAPNGGLGGSLISQLSGAASAASHLLVAAVDKISDLPVLAEWVSKQLSDTRARDALFDALWKLAAIIGVGIVGEWLVRRVLDKPRHALEGRNQSRKKVVDLADAVVRIPSLLGRTLLDVLPVAAFVAAAYAMLPVLQPGGKTQLLVVIFFNAYLISRVSLVVMRMVLVPGAPGLRLLPLSGETANYLYIWSRRLIVVWVVGFYLVEAARFLGMPGAGADGLLRLVGLLVAMMLVVFVMQNRQGVAKWIRGKHHASSSKSAGARLRRRLADVWHVLAIVYVVGVFFIWALDVEGGFEYLARATVISGAIILIARIAAHALRRAVDRGFAVRPEVKARFPMLEARVNRYVPLVHIVLRVLLSVVAGIALLQAWGVDALGWLESPFGQRIVASSFSIAFVLVCALVLWESVSTAIERYLSQTDADGNVVERSARARTLLPLLRNALMVVLLVLVTLIVLSEFGVNIGPLLAGAGVVGLAIGFGSQKMVQDLITGAFILFEDSISVGDVVTAAGISGVVERLSIRSIRLRDLSGNVHTIPFSSVDTVTNMTKEFSMAVIEAGVAYRESVDEVMEVIRTLAEEFEKDPEFGPLILEPMEMLGVEALADSAVVIKFRFKTLPIKQWSVKREFQRRMKNRFDELGIEIPFPHQTLYFGQDKDGSAPPAFIRTQTVGSGKLGRDGKAVEDHAESQPPTVDLPSEDEADN